MPGLGAAPAPPPRPAARRTAPLPPPVVTVHGGDGYSLCIECGQPATEGLYKEYSKDNIRLSRCESCGTVADRLIECELLLVGLDLALHRLPAWRHILFNRKPHAKLQWPQLLRMAVVLVLIDTHIKYAVYVHYSSLTAPQPPDHIDPTDTPTYQVALLLRILLLSLLEHVVFIGVVAGLAMWRLGARQPWDRLRPPNIGVSSTPSSSSSSSSSSTSSKAAPSSSSTSSKAPKSFFSFPSFVGRKLVQGLLYPTFGRLIVVFVMIWDPAIVVANLISLLVLSSQWQALRTVVSAAVALDGTGRSKKKKRGRRSVEVDAAVMPFVVGLACKCLLRLAAFRVDASCTNLYLV